MTLAVDRVATLWTRMKATEGNTAARTWDEVAEHFEYSLPHRALTFPSLENLISTVGGSGSFYWSPGAIQFFDAQSHKVSDKHPLAADRFWVESRQFHPGPYSDEPDDAPRIYTIAWVYRAPTTTMLQIEKVGEYHTLQKARLVAQDLGDLVQQVIPQHTKES